MRGGAARSMDWHYTGAAPREVVVCDRRRTRLATSGAKTDRIDADKLSELLWKNAVHPVYLLRLRDGESQNVGRAYLQQLETATELVASARAQLLGSAQRQAAFELLQTIPYVGQIRAAELIAVVGQPDRFRSLRRFWAYGGLGVIQRVSSEHRIENGRAVRDELRRGIRLLPAGQPMLKKILRDIALHASLGKGVFRVIYDQHIARGKTPGIARVALARKIASIILAVWRSGKSFDPGVLFTKTTIRGEHQEGSLASS